MHCRLKCRTTKVIERPCMLFIGLVQNMRRAARAPAPRSGAAVAMAPMALEFELDVVPAGAPEEAPAPPGEVGDETKLFEDDVVEDVPFPAEELELDAPAEPDADEV